MRRDATDPRAVTTVVLASSLDRPPRLEVPKEIPHEVVHLDPADGVVGLARLAARAAESGRLLHVLWHDTRIVDDVWALEAMGLFELFPDTAMVGGRLHQNGRIVDAGAYFGFGRGCDAPDRGRALEDPGITPRRGSRIRSARWHSTTAVLDSHFAADALATLVPSGVVARSAGRVAGRRGASPGAARHLHAVPVRDTNVDRSSHGPRRGHAGLHDRAWRSDARGRFSGRHIALALRRTSRLRSRRAGAAVRRAGSAAFTDGQSSKPIGWRATVLPRAASRRVVHRDDERLRSFSGTSPFD